MSSLLALKGNITTDENVTNPFRLTRPTLNLLKDCEGQIMCVARFRRSLQSWLMLALADIPYRFDHEVKAA